MTTRLLSLLSAPLNTLASKMDLPYFPFTVHGLSDCGAVNLVMSICLQMNVFMFEHDGD